MTFALVLGGEELARMTRGKNFHINVKGPRDIKIVIQPGVSLDSSISHQGGVARKGPKERDRDQLIKNLEYHDEGLGFNTEGKLEPLKTFQREFPS